MNTILPAYLSEDKQRLVLLDQTLLPNEEKFLELDKREDIFEAIKKLRVRGAPAIGIAAAFGMYVCTNAAGYATKEEMKADFKEMKDYFASSRPTAVNLFWALDRMEKRFEAELSNEDNSIDDIIAALCEESEAVLAEDQEMAKSIGRHGLELFEKGMTIATYCNAGGLATSGYGTALAPVYLGNENGYDLKVIAHESRPLLQGARLTSYELYKAGIEVTLACDNMSSIMMKKGMIDAVIVGADRIAANGDTANKIGTSGVAILAKEYGIPFYVAAPTSTIDMSLDHGDLIEIEMRDPEEVSNGFGRRTGPKEVKVFNPAFDVTDNKYITGIITEKGVVLNPDTASMKEHMDS